MTKFRCGYNHISASKFFLDNLYITVYTVYISGGDIIFLSRRIYIQLLRKTIVSKLKIMIVREVLISITRGGIL